MPPILMETEAHKNRPTDPRSVVLSHKCGTPRTDP